MKEDPGSGEQHSWVYGGKKTAVGKATKFAGMLLWAIADLQSGILPIGGETAVGRGIFCKPNNRLEAKIQLDGDALDEKKVKDYMQKAALWCKGERMGEREMETYEKYKQKDKESVDDVLKQVNKYFNQDKAWIYAVLDYAVGFGVYENNCFFCQSGRKKELVPLEWDYLQELRVFNSKGEIRLNKRNEKWVGRYRGEKSGLEDGERIEEEYFIDEYQKLWGSAQNVENMNIQDWSLLTSGRGTRIWVPIKIEENQGASILVRKFMRIPKEEHLELVYQTDIRMVEICPWKEEGEKGGQYE